MKTTRISAFILAALMTLSLAVPAFAEERTVRVSSGDELRELIARCRLDTYSEGLTVLLDSDIDLKNEPIEPFATFSGCFDGQGHTVSGLKLSTDGAHQGFFRYVQENAVIRSLHVAGTVSPENIRTETGGFCGSNYGLIEDCSFTGEVRGLEKTGGFVGENLGTVRNCSFSGEVSGKRYTGGIAGYNAGRVEGCTNTGAVNTVIVNSAVDIDEISLADISSIPVVTAEAADTVSDTGGIAGLSTDSGVLMDCLNTGSVGYQHYGYNVGGIAGRQSGYLCGCENRGSVLGRKDVGGIVGQMEPFMLMSAADNLLEELRLMSDALGAAMGRLGSGAYELGGIFDDLEADTEAAIGGALDLAENADADDVPQEIRDLYDQLVNADEDGTGEAAPEEDSEPAVTPEEVFEEIDKAINGAEEIIEDLGEGTVEDILEGDLTDEDKKKIAEAAEDAAGDAQKHVDEMAEELRKRIEAEEAEEEQRKQNLDGAVDVLTDSMGGISGNLARLNASITGTMSLFAADMQAVNQHFFRASQILSCILNGDRVIYDDVSDNDTPEMTDGKLLSCVNSGTVDGDTGIGGIAGDMGIELDFDLEGILNGKMDNITSTTYAARCVARDCVNNGVISGKKNCIGGVVGYAELGSIIGCEGYGAVSSESGSYVGGVVGRSDAAVRDCYAMCELSGEEYVGGIAGLGTKISGCGSRISVSAGIASVGAIAGWADVRAQETVAGTEDKKETEERPCVFSNRFVSAELGGVDGVSYAGRAEPLTNEEFLAEETVPDRFRALTVTFSADGKTVKVLSGLFGKRLNAAEIPEVPEKDGYSGSWPESAEQELLGDTVIEAVYRADQSSIASERGRQDGDMSVLLLSGSFRDGAELELTEFDGCELSAPGLTVLEKWELRITNNEDRSGSYSVHYLTPALAERRSRLAVYVLDGDTWVKVNTRTSGSYTVFDGSGDSMVFCAASWQAEDPTVYAAAAAAAAVLAAVIIFAAVRGRRKKKAASKAAD